MRYPVGAVAVEYQMIVPTGMDPVAENTSQYSILEGFDGSFDPAGVDGPEANLE